MLLLMRGFKVHCRQRHNLIIFPAGRNLPQFQAMVERVSLPAYLAARSSRRLLATNQQFQRLMGYSASDLESLTLDDLRPPEDIPLLIESMTEFRNEGTLERRYRTKQGRLLNVRLSFYDMSLSRNEWQLPHATFVVLSDLEKTGDPRAGLYR